MALKRVFKLHHAAALLMAAGMASTDLHDDGVRVILAG